VGCDGVLDSGDRVGDGSDPVDESGVGIEEGVASGFGVPLQLLLFDDGVEEDDKETLFFGACRRSETLRAREQRASESMPARVCR